MYITDGRIAQSVERWSNKPLVMGSSPIVTIFLSVCEKREQKCLDRGSNTGPLDLQSNALPTELSKQVMSKSTLGGIV